MLNDCYSRHSCIRAANRRFNFNDATAKLRALLNAAQLTAATTQPQEAHAVSIIEANRRFPSSRPRRMRRDEFSRRLMRETRLTTDDLIYPLFIVEGSGQRQPIDSMPGIERLSIDELLKEAAELVELNIPAIALFPAPKPETKSLNGAEAYNPDGLVQRAIRALKADFPVLGVITDVALDPYTTHGQDGIIDSKGEVDNDSTVEILAKASIVYANAGIDWVAPSDMMDGRIKIIREALERNSFHNTGIISYSAKFSSSYYGPFRSAIGSSMDSVIIDKSTYQLNPANLLEAQRELALDAEEGADILMVKPAEPFLDVIKQARSQSNLPIAAYQVSGEYSRIMAANQLGWLDWKSCALESLVGIKRAGANIIFSYFADRLAKDL